MSQAVLEAVHQDADWHWYGSGHCPGHFGELVQGAFSSERGHLRGLVTLPCRKIGTVCSAKISDGCGRVSVPEGKKKVRRAVDAFRRFHDIQPDIDIVIELKSSIPAGIGMGSSTADIVATIRALDQAFGVSTSDQELAKLTLKAEAACDSTMFCRQVKIFAQREGTVIEDFGRPFMPLLIKGFNLMPGEGFQTDETPPAEYGPSDIERFDELRGELREALRSNSAERVADIATRSAMINQRHFPKRNFADLMTLHRRFEALGVCISHSGTIAGLLFSVSESPSALKRQRVKAAAREAGIEPLGLFKI